MQNISIREAVISDAPIILGFITELAVFENAEHEVLSTVEDIEETVFASDSTAHALIGELNNEPVAMAVYFFNYSTWLGKNGLYLEDLYVSQAHRRIGAGKAMLRHLAKLAVEKNCGRFEWSVLDWNQPAIDLYESVGAVAQSEWVGYRLAGPALADFARKS